jgi:hypothetical protein
MGVGEAGWGLGTTRRGYLEVETGRRPRQSSEYEAIVRFFGWPRATEGRQRSNASKEKMLLTAGSPVHGSGTLI